MENSDFGDGATLRAQVQSAGGRGQAQAALAPLAAALGSAPLVLVGSGPVPGGKSLEKWCARESISRADQLRTHIAFKLLACSSVSLSQAAF